MLLNSTEHTEETKEKQKSHEKKLSNWLTAAYSSHCPHTEHDIYFVMSVGDDDDDAVIYTEDTTLHCHW